jgi:Xaa-Pro aminopeptidase
MKRGLVVLDPAEVPEQERPERVARLQRRLTEEGVTIGLVYGDVHRSDDIGYLTNLCIYWNEGILAVPAEGDPAFLMKLSPRVHPWMRRSSTLTDLRSGKGFPALVQGLVEDKEPGVLGLVDAALWPATAVEEVRAAAPGWEVRALGGVVREQRLVPSAAELALLGEAAGHLATALDAGTAPDLPDGERIALLEQALRGAGYTDLMVEVVHGPDGVSAVEVTGQFRFGWLRAARLVAPPAGAAVAPWAAAVQNALAAARGAVAPGVAAAVPAATAENAFTTGLPAGAIAHATVVHQADLSTGGDYASPDEELPAGAVVVVGVEVLFPDGGRVAVADTVRVAVTGAEDLHAEEQHA